MSRLNVPVEEYTTPNPVVIGEEATIAEMTELMRKNDVRHLPVVRKTGVVGIISERDLKVASGLSRDEKKLIRASDIMARDPVTVSAGTTLADVAFEMSKAKIGSVIVNDEQDQLLGIFTITDALNALIEIARSPGDQFDVEYTEDQAFE